MTWVKRAFPVPIATEYGSANSPAKSKPRSLRAVHTGNKATSAMSSTAKTAIICVSCCLKPPERWPPHASTAASAISPTLAKIVRRVTA